MWKEHRLALLQPLRQDLGQLVVDLVARDFTQLVFKRQPYRILVTEGLIGFRAPPVKLLPTLAPITPFPFTYCRGHMAVDVGLIAATGRLSQNRLIGRAVLTT